MRQGKGWRTIGYAHPELVGLREEEEGDHAHARGDRSDPAVIPDVLNRHFARRPVRVCENGHRHHRGEQKQGNIVQSGGVQASSPFALQ